MAIEFDESQLEAISGGDAAFAREVLEEYLACAPQDVERLRTAVAAAECRQVTISAHTLKGSSATIGATGIAAVALELELAGKRTETAAFPAALARLEIEFAGLETFLRERIARAA